MNFRKNKKTDAVINYIGFLANSENQDMIYANFKTNYGLVYFVANC